MNNIVRNFLQFQISLKIYHWQTKSYSRHRASDSLVSSISDKVDVFIESLQGKLNSRVNFSQETNIHLINMTDKDAVVLLLKFSKWLSGGLEKQISKHKDLINLRDEMLALVDQTLYLFSFNKS
jgi:hypothetical protein